MSHRRKWCMDRTVHILALWFAAFLVAPRLPLVAQDCRIYTAVYDVRSKDARSSSKTENAEARQIIGRNVTLFHSGKVYDCLDTLGEVTIFEPTRGEFSLISRSRMKIARVSVSELQRLVADAEERAAAHCLQLGDSKDPLAKAQLAWTRFQLAPDFRETWDESRRQLRLTNAFCEYRVTCTPVESPQFVEAYSRFADWTARLNYLLYPQALAPAPRLRLNAALRRQRALPIDVELTAGPKQELHLCAEHKVRWSLDEADRRMIHDSESMLKDRSFELVNFATFQRAITRQASSNPQSTVSRPPQR